MRIHVPRLDFIKHVLKIFCTIFILNYMFHMYCLLISIQHDTIGLMKLCIFLFVCIWMALNIFLYFNVFEYIWMFYGIFYNSYRAAALILAVVVENGNERHLNQMSVLDVSIWCLGWICYLRLSLVPLSVSSYLWFRHTKPQQRPNQL